MEEFEKLYRKYLDTVFRCAFRCVGRREIAEEITADAFLALYRNLDRVEEAQLPAVVRNRATDYRRHCAVEERYAAAAAWRPGLNSAAPPWLGQPGMRGGGCAVRAPRGGAASGGARAGGFCYSK